MRALPEFLCKSDRNRPLSHVFRILHVMLRSVPVPRYVVLFSSFFPGSFMMLLILAVQNAKILFYIRKVIFLFIFFDKSLEVSILFLIFATNSVSPFVWVSGLFTGKRTFMERYLWVSNLANLDTLKKRTTTGSVHEGCIIS